MAFHISSADAQVAEEDEEDLDRLGTEKLSARPSEDHGPSRWEY